MFFSPPSGHRAKRSRRGSYRCIALDYPGFGISEAPPGFGFTPREESLVVEELVNRLGLHDLTLVMQDWGGPIGLGLAGRRPELVPRVVLGSTWAWPTSTSEPRGKFSVIAGGPVGEFAQVNFNAFASFGLQHGVAHELPPDILDAYLRPFRPLDRRGIAAFYPGQITAATPYFTEVEGGLSRVADREALIFWALKDEGFPRRSRPLRGDLPGAQDCLAAGGEPLLLRGLGRSDDHGSPSVHGPGLEGAGRLAPLILAHDGPSKSAATKRLGTARGAEYVSETDWRQVPRKAPFS